MTPPHFHWYNLRAICNGILSQVVLLRWFEYDFEVSMERNRWPCPQHIRFHTYIDSFFIWSRPTTSVWSFCILHVSYKCASFQEASSSLFDFFLSVSIRNSGYVYVGIYMYIQSRVVVYSIICIGPSHGTRIDSVRSWCFPLIRSFFTGLHFPFPPFSIWLCPYF